MDANTSTFTRVERNGWSTPPVASTDPTIRFPDEELAAACLISTQAAEQLMHLAQPETSSASLNSTLENGFLGKSSCAWRAGERQAINDDSRKGHPSMVKNSVCNNFDL
jgi:hypothetical protein